jgi:hypothetical protein
MSDQMARDLASLARTLSKLSLRCEKQAIEFPKYADQLLAEARYKRRASWRYLEFARQEKEAADEIRARNIGRAA